MRDANQVDQFICWWFGGVTELICSYSIWHYVSVWAVLTFCMSATKFFKPEVYYSITGYAFWPRREDWYSNFYFNTVDSRADFFDFPPGLFSLSVIVALMVLAYALPGLLLLLCLVLLLISPIMISAIGNLPETLFRALGFKERKPISREEFIERQRIALELFEEQEIKELGLTEVQLSEVAEKMSKR